MSSLFNFKYEVDTDKKIYPEPHVDSLNEEFMESFDAKRVHYVGDKDIRESDVERTGKSMNIFNLDLSVLEDRSDFEASIRKSKNDAAYRATLTGAKQVKGKGYDEPNKQTQNSNFTFPELSGVFAPKMPELKGVEKNVVAKDMSDTTDTDYHPPHNQHKDATAVHMPGTNQEPMVGLTPLDIATSLHARISARVANVGKHISIEHLVTALKSGMTANQIEGQAMSPLGRKRLRGMTESAEFTSEWKIEILKEGNLHKYSIKDEDDVIAEGVNLTYDGAMKLAVRTADELAAQIEEQVLVMQEEKKFEDGKYSRVLNAVKELIK